MANVDSLVVEFPDNDGFENIDFRFGVGFIRVVYAPIDFQIYAGYGRSTPIRFVRAGERVDLCLPDLTDNISIAWGIAPAVPGAEYAKAILMISDSWLEASGASAQSIGLAVYDSLGQIRGWNPWADSSSVTNLNAGLVSITNTSIPVTPTGTVTVTTTPIPTYDIVGRRTARDYNTGVIFAAAGRSPLLTLWNATSGVTGRLLSADVAVLSTTVATELWVDLIAISSLPTGGSGMTPVPRDIGAATPNIVSRRVPTGGAAESGDPLSSVLYSLGVTGAVSVVNPAVPVPWQSLYKANMDYEQNPTFGVGEGLAIVADVNAACTVRFAMKMSFMEVV